LKKNEWADNPEKCPYYITLQSLLANYPLLSGDKANERFIKQRLLQFEKDIQQSEASSAIISKYSQRYYNALGLASIRFANSNQVIAAAKNTYPIVDAYYLDNRLFCTNPLYQWAEHRTRRILLYNISSLYEYSPSRFMRILSAMPQGPQLGVFSGFFVNNQSTTLVSQFMTGIPLFTALYIMPGYDYARIGSYSCLVPWNYFHVGFLLDSFLRKLSNITGIDIFTVQKKDLARKTVPQAIPLQSKLNPLFDDGYQSFINKQSYGMAYLANRIHYEDPREIKHDEGIIKDFFAHADNPKTDQFMMATNVFYQKLMTLKNKHDILLESLSPDNMDVREMNKPAGSVEIKGMIGERALFTSHCERKNCIFVFNAAKAPGWHAIVNGQSTPIQRANFGFMSTEVPKGNSTIWFIYSALPNTISYFVSILSLIMVFIISRYGTFRKNPFHEII